MMHFWHVGVVYLSTWHVCGLIRCQPADYEVVDVDGFIFKRKRKAVHLEEEAVEPEGNYPALQEEHQTTEQSRVEPATSNPVSNQEILQAVWGLEPESAKQHALTLLAAIELHEDPQQALPALSDRLAMVRLDELLTASPCYSNHITRLQ